MIAEPKQKVMDVGGVEISVDEGVYQPYYVGLDDILYKLPDLADCKCVLDMGTGTGVLPVLWAENFPSIEKIVAVDSNPRAVANARRNTARFGDRISVLESDLFEAFEAKNSSLLRKLTNNKFGKFDAIIFNGPNVDTDDPGKNKALSEKLDKLGPSRVNDLCDFGLRMAERFFRSASNYLDDKGFIIYTFSDYCQIERLFRIIADSEAPYVATLLSVMEFTSRDLDAVKHRTHNVPLWYNIKIKHKKHMQLSELTRGFRKAVVKLSGYYAAKKRADTAHIKEHRAKTESLLKCLTSQLDRLLDPNGWLISGFSLADWNRKKADLTAEHTLLYSFGSAVVGPVGKNAVKPHDRLAGLRKEMGRRLEDRLIKYLREKQDFIVISDYLVKPNVPRVIEAHLTQRNRINYLPGIKKLTVELDSNNLHPSLDLSEAMTTTTALLRSLSAIDTALADYPVPEWENNEDLLKLVHTLWLNFSAIKTEGGRGMTHIKFTKIDNPMVGLSGSVYFFSALEPTQENNEMLAALEEVIGVANDSLMNPIWASIRQEYALRSAIAAIMSRNMSHNLGSHVLWHLAQKLEHKADLLETPQDDGDHHPA